MAGLIWFIAGIVCLVAGIAGVKLLIQPASGLRLTVFRPWRGDAWPQGVQEDDDARFDWSAAKRRRATIRLGWEATVAAPTTPDHAIDPDPIDVALEELADGAVVVEPIDAVSVRHRPH